MHTRYALIALVLAALQPCVTATGLGTASSSSSPPAVLQIEPIDPNSLKRKRVDDSTGQTKQCSKCKHILPMINFNKDKYRKDGLDYRCKACQKARRPKCAKCGTNPIFGFVPRKPTHCVTHRIIGMRDAINPKCASCDRRPSFGVETGRPIYCKKHKLNDMFDVKNVKCKYEGGCNRHPTFGIDKREFCAEHKTQDMISLTQRCTDANCSRPAIYSFAGEKALRCSAHAVDGMVDVVHRRCSQCDKFASHGIPGCSRTKCGQHKQPGMILLRHTRCVEDGCTNTCTHGVGVAKWCEEHALSTHTNLVERQCSDCGLVQILNADNKCEFCDTQLDEPAKVHLRKQKELQAFLDADPELADYDFTDRQLKYEADMKCATSHRPDFVWDMGTHLVVVENDEFKHRGSSYQCEELRMRQIAEDMMRPVIYIRFNCDGWTVNGVAQKITPANRITELKKWIVHCRDVVNLVGVVSTVHLFYDEFNAAETEVKVLLANFE